jgi:hypothetical protein
VVTDGAVDVDAGAELVAPDVGSLPFPPLLSVV